MVVVLALRGAAAVLVLTTLVGGIPRIVQVALAASIGLWSALMVGAGDLGVGGDLGALGGGIGALVSVPTWALAVHELAIGAALGVLGAVPLLAASAAGRLVDLSGTGKAQGTYAVLFGVLAAAVFVGVDGHVRVMVAIVDSHDGLPALAMVRPTVVSALGVLVPSAVQLAVPWLVTAAVVQIAMGVGTRVGGRVASHAPVAAAVPAALAMMTAALVATFAVSMAAMVRGAV